MVSSRAATVAQRPLSRCSSDGFPPPTRTSHRADQGGFSLLEILVGMLIGLLVVAAAVFLFNRDRPEQRSTGSISASNSAFRTGNRFADDVASVSPVAG